MSLFWDDYQGGGVLSVSLTLILTRLSSAHETWKCYSSQERHAAGLLAKFTPRSHLRRQGQPIEPPKLLVTPAGHEVFDDLLVSALVIERTRTAPSSS
jgi:para-aminobenzoate synthetase